MKISGMQKTGLPGAWTVWGERHEDQRGLVREIWCGETSPWKLTLLTTNRYRVLRGFHADTKRWRMLTCVAGEVRHVLADKKTKQWIRHALTPHGPSLLWQPGIYSGYYVLSTDATVVYHVSEMYRSGDQKTLNWNFFGLEPWHPINELILSERDKKA